MERAVYVAFGDSITEGYGVREGFVSHFAARIRSATPNIAWTVVRSGVSGDTASGAFWRLESDVTSHHPQLVTVNFGVNDAFSGISPERFRANMTWIVSAIREAGCERIVLLSSEVIPDPGAEAQVLPYWKAMRQAAVDTGALYADVNGCWRRELEGGRSEEDLIIAGDLHPNEAGHRLIAQAVWNAVTEHGLLEGL